MSERQAALCTRCAATTMPLTNAATGATLDAEPGNPLEEYREWVRRINELKKEYLTLVCQFIEFKRANPGLPNVEFYFLAIQQGDILDTLQTRGAYLTA